MTLAAVKKLAIKLPPQQRLQLADVLYESLPLLRGSVGLAELERRADEVISGKVKGIPWEEFKRDLREMRKSITPKRHRQGGRATSGARPVPRSQG
jgi:putative addiction module component (TIGR02574 family)